MVYAYMYVYVVSTQCSKELLCPDNRKRVDQEMEINHKGVYIYISMQWVIIVASNDLSPVRC